MALACAQSLGNSWVFRALALSASLSFGLHLSGCTHPAERALEGRWVGKSVENFDHEDMAAATGWARGTSFLFEGSHLRVTVPTEVPRSGVYRLTAIENRQVSLMVLDRNGEETELDLVLEKQE
jgi:hypothetical protein